MCRSSTRLPPKTVQQRGQPFSSFITDAANSRILRGYVQNWIASVGAQFDRVGVAKTAPSLAS